MDDELISFLIALGFTIVIFGSVIGMTCFILRMIGG